MRAAAYVQRLDAMIPPPLPVQRLARACGTPGRSPQQSHDVGHAKPHEAGRSRTALCSSQTVLNLNTTLKGMCTHPHKCAGGRIQYSRGMQQRTQRHGGSSWEAWGTEARGCSIMIRGSGAAGGRGHVE